MSEGLFMKKSNYNYNLQHSGLTKDNLTLLKNAPRPTIKQDKETQRMLQGKCSLKELLKSAATRLE